MVPTTPQQDTHGDTAITSISYKSLDRSLRSPGSSPDVTSSTNEHSLVYMQLVFVMLEHMHVSCLYSNLPMDLFKSLAFSLSIVAFPSKLFCSKI